MVAANGLGLCVRAGFGALNCQPALNLNRSTKLQVYTSPRLTQNPCYVPLFLSFVIVIPIAFVVIVEIFFAIKVNIEFVPLKISKLVVLL